MKEMVEVTARFEERGEEKVALALDEGCRDLKAEKFIECMWRKRFCYGMCILVCFNTIILLSATWGCHPTVCAHEALKY